MAIIVLIFIVCYNGTRDVNFMPTKKTNDNKKLDIEAINDSVNLSKKILKILYVAMIIGVILLITLVVKQWHIPKFILTFLGVLTPLFIGYIIAWIFNPLVEFLHRNGFKKGLAVVVVYLGFIALLYLFLSMLVPTVINQFNDLVSAIPNIFSGIKDFINECFNNISNVSPKTLNNIKNGLYSNIGSFFYNIVEGLPNTLMSGIGSIFSGIGTFLISLIIGFYMLFDFNSIHKHFVKLIPKKYRYEVTELTDEIGRQLRKYVNGVFGVASIILVGCSIGFAVIGLKAPLLFGMFCGITDLIPYIGPYIGGAAAVVVGFSQSPLTGILALVVIIIFQTLESYIIQPIVMSKTMKLHPVTILIGLTIFGSFFGIVGMVLATPIIAFLKIIFKFFNEKYNLVDLDIE